MATVTIAKSYFDALLRRAESPASEYDANPDDGLYNKVTISKPEHKYLLQAAREYQLLKSALFRGGLTTETLETLLEGESGATQDDPSQSVYTSDDTFARAKGTSVSLATSYNDDCSSYPDHSTPRNGAHFGARARSHRWESNYDELDSAIDSPPEVDDEEEYGQTRSPRVPVHDQRTILISNLSDRTTHKELADVIRGGRLLDIFLRKDRSATVSFVEGAAEFLAYTKRNDIYLHMKRLEFRWGDRQFHVPTHVANKIASGATRNLVARGVAGKLTADQIRDHLDHIHNLIVVDISFKGGDAYISTNSVHNALFARTCMMSRSVYKGTRVEHYPDECAGPLPRVNSRVHTPIRHVPLKSVPIVNQYALLDTESDDDSGTEDGSYLTSGVRVDGHGWADTAVA